METLFYALGFIAVLGIVIALLLVERRRIRKKLPKGSPKVRVTPRR